MKRLPGVVLFSVVALGQHVNPVNTGAGMQAPPNAYPYGNILFPGGAAVSQSHAARLAATVSGNPIQQVPHYDPRVGPRGGFGAGHGRTVVVPYAYPVYVGGDYGYGYGYQQPQPAPNVTVVVPQQPAPSVIINHNYTPETAKPVLRDYSNSELPESGGLRIYDAPVTKRPEPPAPARRSEDDDKPTIYLIVLKDASVHSAIGYWVEDGTLHYVTPQGSVNRVTLDRLDREATEQLNRERKVEFDLKLR